MISIEEIAAELPNIDYETQRHISYCIATYQDYVWEFNSYRKIGKSWDYIETLVQECLDGAIKNDNGSLIEAYEWKLEVLKHTREKEQHDNG